MYMWRLVCAVVLGCVACGGGSGVHSVVDPSILPATAMDAQAGDGGWDDATVPSDGPSMDVPAAAPTWSEVYSQILVNGSSPSNCLGSACHDPGVEKGLDLSTLQNGYKTILRRVTPGMPAASDLVTVLQSGYMPRGRPQMPAWQVQQISAWIQAGAQDN